MSQAEEIARLSALVEQLCRLQYRNFKILHGLINGQIESRLENKRWHGATRTIVRNALSRPALPPSPWRDFPHPTRK